MTPDPKKHSREEQRPTATRRPLGISILAVLTIISCLLAVLFGLSLFGTGLVAWLSTGMLEGEVVPLLAAAWLVIAFFQLAAGLGLWALEPWAWLAEIVLQLIVLALTLVEILFAGADWTDQVVSLALCGFTLLYLLSPHVRKAFGMVRALRSEEMSPTGQSRVGRWATNVLGVAVIVACVMIPLVSALMSGASEHSATAQYLQTPKVQSRALGSTPAEQDYYLLNGCIFDRSICGKSTGPSWGEYFIALRQLYMEHEPVVTGGNSEDLFARWAKEHVHFLSTTNGIDGAHFLDEALQQNKSATVVHLIGTSAGGAAIVTYLSREMRGEVQVDPRVADALVVDAPLGFRPPLVVSNFAGALQAGLMKSDVEPDLGVWLQGRQVDVLVVDTPFDAVSNDPLPDIADDSSPVYPDSNTPPVPLSMGGCNQINCAVYDLFEWFVLRNTWHEYTGAHVSTSARSFIEAHWKK